MSKLETAGSSVQPRSIDYMPALDGLRALGIFLVFVHHMITPLIFGGQVGVDVFFVLSGFLITTILLREWSRHQRIRFRRFYLRRAVRLYPALLLAMIVLFVPGMIFAPSSIKYAAESLFAITYATPVALLFADGAAKAWRHTWSLGIEEMFYFLWPILLVFCLRRRFSRTWIAGIAGIGGVTLLAVPVVIEFTGNEPLVLRSGGLFVGCSLALIIRSSNKFTDHAAVGAIGMSFIAAAAAIATVYRADALAVILACFGTAAVIAHANSRPSSLLSRSLGVKPIAYFGRISYELYIWHFPVLVILAWATNGDFVSVAWVAAPLTLVLSVVTHEILKNLVSSWKQRIA